MPSFGRYIQLGLLEKLLGSFDFEMCMKILCTWPGAPAGRGQAFAFVLKQLDRKSLWRPKDVSKL